jgi:ABC-2 type transport system ATP-binding protein
MTDMIEVSGLSKAFFLGLLRKRTEAVVDISLRVEAGEIFGFLGPNGAGKTTTIKSILGLIRPSGGTISVLGQRADSIAWRKDVGYMPEHPNFYDFLTGHELVAWFGQLAGLGRHEAEAGAKRQLERVGLGHAMNRPLRKYSKGMMQRAGLAQAMVGSPKLLILDEPMTGLDPIGRKDIRELILGLKAEGKTVFYSTHILPDVEMTCDRVSIVHKGRTRRTGKLSEILSETSRGVTIAFEGIGGDEAEKVRREHPTAVLEEGELRLELDSVAKARELAGALLGIGGKLVRFEPHRADLESIFMRTLGEDQPREETRS